MEVCHIGFLFVFVAEQDTNRGWRSRKRGLALQLWSGYHSGSGNLTLFELEVAPFWWCVFL